MSGNQIKTGSADTSYTCNMTTVPYILNSSSTNSSINQTMNTSVTISATSSVNNIVATPRRRIPIVRNAMNSRGTGNIVVDGSLQIVNLRRRKRRLLPYERDDY